MKTYSPGGMAFVLVMGAAFPAALLGQSSDTMPAPGEEVMRPTRMGVRLTPAMARAMVRVVMRGDMSEDNTLDNEQDQRIVECAARRMMRIANRDGRDIGPVVEYFFEAMMADEGKIKPENAREFGERIQPLVREFREVIDGTLEDARPMLDEAEFKSLEALAKRQAHKLDRLEVLLQDYAQGGLQQAERPLAVIEREELLPGRSQVNGRILGARNSARQELLVVAGRQWDEFLTEVEKLFKFDQSQQAKGRALLAELHKKTKAITTPEWKGLFLRHRVLLILTHWLPKEVAREPWSYHLAKQGEEVERPLTELGQEFCGQVLALVTPQQREYALGVVGKLADKHGLVVSDDDWAMLRGALEPEQPLSPVSRPQEQASP